MRSGVVFSTRGYSEWKQCRCGESFFLNIPTMYALWDRKKVELARIDHQIDFTLHRASCVNEYVEKEILSG